MIKANNPSGFTLIELLISMAIAGMMLAGMILAFTAQSRTYNTQQEISTLQEDLKAAMQLMSRDIRMAGYDPQGTAGSSVIAATATTFSASQDLNGNGVLVPIAANPDETILYSFATPAPGFTAPLMRSSNGGVLQPVIDNLTHVDFEYQTITLNGSAAWTAVWTRTPGAALASISVVKICMQGRTPRQTSTTTDTSAFKVIDNTTGGGATLDWTPAVPGKFQWRTMCVEVKRRNFLD